MLLPPAPTYRKGPTYRLHNRRIALITTSTGEYQFHFKKLLTSGEVEELLAGGYHNTVEDQIIRGRIRYSVLTVTPEAWEAMTVLQANVAAKQQRIKSF